MIKRKYKLEDYLKSGKVLIIYGARQVGKTTLVMSFLENYSFKYKIDTGDDMRLRELFATQKLKEILEYAEDYRLIVIDEAQQIKEAGKTLKMLVDNVPDLSVIATGSSSFELSGMLGEPLTGRKTTLLLFPFSQSEMRDLFNKFELKEKIEEFLLYGSYPEVVLAKSRNEKIAYIEELVNSYLLKDLLAIDRIKSPLILVNLSKLLAFQIGNLVSLNELSAQLHIDVKTVGRYLDLLEKAFVIKKISGYSSNLRDEIKSKCKYYFLDNGIRNGIIGQFNTLSNRNDVGALWENFMFNERLKKITYEGIKPAHFYFWRTYNGSEIDLIEEVDGKITAYELKWKSNKSSGKKKFLEQYPNVPVHIINGDNYLDFLL